MIAAPLLLGIALAAAPAADPALARRVDALLGSIERPATAAQWRALGPEAVPVLERIAADPRGRPSRRARAVEGLAAMGGPRAESAVLAAVRDQGAPWPVRAAGARGAGRLLDENRLPDALSPTLEADPDPRVRAAAAEALARHAPSRTCPAIHARAARDRQAAVYRRALAICDGK